MNALTEVFSNRILLAVLCAWFLAQFLKFIIVLATESKVEFDRLFGARRKCPALTPPPFAPSSHAWAGYAALVRWSLQYAWFLRL